MSIPEDLSRYGEFAAIVEAYDGQTHWFDQGYHATFRFWLADGGTDGVHLYRYELVLHEPNGERIMGYDNAHPLTWKAGKFKRHSKNADHYHRDKTDKRPTLRVHIVDAATRRLLSESGTNAYPARYLHKYYQRYDYKRER